MRLAFLISGSGTTLANYLEKQKSLLITGEVVVVISSRKDAFGINYAKNAGIPYYIIEYKEYKNDIEKYSSEITNVLIANRVELVVMGGFLSFYKIPSQYENRVINIHPALSPSFSGKGMYGMKVHEAVFNSGVKYTGCTVHFVDNEYDHGAIIAQSIVEITPEDNAKSIKDKVTLKERELYPHVIKSITENKLRNINGRYFIVN